MSYSKHKRVEELQKLATFAQQDAQDAHALQDWQRGSKYQQDTVTRQVRSAQASADARRAYRDYAMAAEAVRLGMGSAGVEWECECDDEYGPCQEHGEAVVIREGASTYTADELLLLFVEDASLILHDAGTELTPWADDVIHRAHGALDTVDEFTHTASLPASTYGERLRDELVTLANQVECDLATLDAPCFTYWDDGYRIVRVLDGCPLVD